MRSALVLALALAASPAPGQDGAQVTAAQGAVVRALDKVTGNARDFDMRNGQVAELGRLRIRLGECRYPTEDPASNAFAWLEITDDIADTPVFEGWMIAAAPAINPLDHPRYDVWVIRCSNPEG
jgi:hypothetical protein